MSDRPTRLIVIDADPVFQLGLQAALASFSDLQIVDRVSTATVVLARLSAARERDDAPDVVILDPAIAASNGGTVDGTNDDFTASVRLCCDIASAFPALSVFLLSAIASPEVLAAARAAGARGYRAKGTPPDELAQAIRRVAAGESDWPVVTPAAIARSLPPTRSRNWLARQRQLGLQVMAENLSRIEAELQRSSATRWDRMFLRGQRRELSAARWLVDRLLPVEAIVVSGDAPRLPAGTSVATQANVADEISSDRMQTASVSTAANSPTADVLNRVLAAMQSALDNSTRVSLEIDILQPEKRRELLYLVWKEVGDAVAELQFQQLAAEDIRERHATIARAIWRSAIVEFFSRHYAPILDASDVRAIDFATVDAPRVRAEKLARIPFAGELWVYLARTEPFLIDNVSYRPESPEARDRAVLLLSNALVQIANGVMQLLLDRFADNEDLKTTLYELRYRSTREIARFRNELSWRSRQERLFAEPMDIFESQYRLFAFADGSIVRHVIYAPRQDELEKLEGIRWATTIVVELRDAISPRLRAIVSFIGSGAVYVLREVLGRGIGLIGRGIISGIGSALQDVRPSRNTKPGDYGND
ncbi:response regulator receiver protein [Rubidibacter lacunae KORDI 51-2]|uniref:Response regulator receiver protein n=1 Tax=Rubidibacter lacunae KORDI 51-2 TaxID=582515 RepID=U5D543_9CHRO|nr:DUF3685 domain-containing protein [Rubidibacter lacunae]ERN39803.1 response regulator receiver protein [Rubidibacter lacunae KORDI 51-2]